MHRPTAPCTGRLGRAAGRLPVTLRARAAAPSPTSAPPTHKVQLRLPEGQVAEIEVIGESRQPGMGRGGGRARHVTARGGHGPSHPAFPCARRARPQPPRPPPASHVPPPPPPPPIHSSDGETILEAAERLAVEPEVPNLCRSGQCFTCVSRLEGGALRPGASGDLGEDLAAAGYVLPCVAVPDGEGVLVATHCGHEV